MPATDMAQSRGARVMVRRCCLDLRRTRPRVATRDFSSIAHHRAARVRARLIRRALGRASCRWRILRRPAWQWVVMGRRGVRPVVRRVVDVASTGRGRPDSLRGGAIRLHVSVAHPAARDLELGKLAEACCEVLAGGPPTGWGVAEPASQQWSRRQITRLCRERVPAPTWLVVVGATPAAPAVGVMESTRSATGVVERLRLCVGSGSTDVVGDLDVIDRLAVRIAESFSVRTMTAWLQPGRGDATRAPVFMGAPIPFGLLVGPEATAIHGAPSDDTLVQAALIGPATRRSCWVRLLPTAQPERAYEALDATLRHFGLPLPNASS